MRPIFTTLIAMLALAGAVAMTAPAGAAAPSTTSAAPDVAPRKIAIGIGSITYYARAGDTLSSIARQLTTKPENWVVLGKLNHINQDSNIPIGTGIVIPADLLGDEPSEGKIVALSGSISASYPDGTPSTLSIGAKVSEGMQIETGSNGFLTLSLPDASRVSLPSNSRVKIAKLRMARYTKSPRTEIMLLRGRVESRVSPLEPSKGRFEIHTPHSVAGVRGTHFRVAIVGNGVTNEVLSGKVAVGPAKNPETLALAGGTGNIIDRKTVGPAVDLLPAPQLAVRTGAQEYQLAQFTLTPIAGAAAYHVQIATDPDAQNIVAENRATTNQVKLDGVPDGDYFLLMSAIDKLGLEGFTRIQAVTLKTSMRSAVLPNPPSVVQSDAKELTLRWTLQAGQKSLVQVARDADFTWLLFTATTATQEAKVPRPPFGTYYARVQIINPDGSLSPFSLAQPFIVTDQWIMNDGNPIRVRENRSNATR